MKSMRKWLKGIVVVIVLTVVLLVLCSCVPRVARPARAGGHLELVETLSMDRYSRVGLVRDRKTGVTYLVGWSWQGGIYIIRADDR